MDGQAPAATNMDLLRQLADANAVATGYWNWYGQWTLVEATTLLRVLQSLGVPVTPNATVDDVRAALEETENFHWRRTLPPTLVTREGWSRDFPVHVPHGSAVTVECLLENGQKTALEQIDHWVDPRVVDGQLTGRATFRIPANLPQGWHRLVAHGEQGRAEATLIVTPQRLHSRCDDGQRRWGVAAQLYSTRSACSWGIGDASDLAELAALSAHRGADFLQINPLHASQPILPLENSPDLPVSRRWVNPQYIRPEDIDEYATAPQDVRDRIEALRLASRRTGTATHSAARGTRWDGRVIERDTAWAAKLAALEELYRLPRSYARTVSYRLFVERGGSELEHYALWSALVEEHHARSGGGMSIPTRAEFLAAGRDETTREALKDRVAFLMWCQWIIADQLEGAQRTARACGMDIGIMADLAVGVHSAGSEVWSAPHLFAPHMTVGAPPDMYSQQGQDWSQPPWSPRALEESGYAPLRDMLRAVMSYAGAVRIDHILGLFRLWWIPSYCGAQEGTYVHYDHEAMVGIVLLEAQRAGVVVIGEDLGTMEPWARAYLQERGILGTSVLWFEKDDAGRPLRPEHYRHQCLVAATTHDLPPTGAYLEGVHTDLREKLDLLVEDPATVRTQDEAEREQMLQRVSEYGLLAADGEQVTREDQVEALHRYIARTPAALLAVALVDAVGDRNPQNLPGTYMEYPNWCMPLMDETGREVAIEELPDLPSWHRLSAAVHEELRG